jgi:hypothetical protein
LPDESAQPKQLARFAGDLQARWPGELEETAESAELAATLPRNPFGKVL